MDKFIIEGGAPLYGRVRIDGAKNAALPVIFSTIMIDGVSVIKNVPDIIDVNNALQILADFGANITFDKTTLTIDTRHLHYKKPSKHLVRSLRASIYLLGACLVRFSSYDLFDPGGCDFDNRPIDMHISCALSLGASLKENTLTCDILKGNTVVFQKLSVGATVNAILLAVGARGVTKIINPASEPHVDTLIEFLKNAGAKIYRENGRITVIGSHLSGSFITLPPDPIESCTYLLLGAMTGGSVGVASKSGLGFCEKKLFSMGLDLQKKNGYYYIVPKRVLYTEIMTGAYPLFPTDIAPVFAPILARYGGGKITEGVWYNRFGYLDALNEFGIRSRRFSHGCEIYPSNIHPATVDACDLRAGAAMLLSALFARGISTVSSANIIKRGYSGINDKLLCLGAKIKNIKE